MGSLIPTPKAAAVCSQSKPNSDAASSLSDELEARTIRLEAGAYAFPAGRGLTLADRRDIARTLDDLGGRLALTIPEDGGHVVEWVATMAHTAFKARDVSTTRQHVYDGFLIALPGRSEPAVREAMRRIVRDEAPLDISRTFAPTPAEVAKLARAIEGEWRLEGRRLARLLDIPEVRPAALEPQPSPEEMEALREKVRRMTAGLRSRRGLAPLAATPAHCDLAGALSPHEAAPEDQGGSHE